MRITPEYMSQSLTVSTRTEAMLVKVDNKYYFIEYPTNRPPNFSKLGSNGEVVSQINLTEFNVLFYCIEEFISLKKKHHFLHAPSFIIGACKALCIDLESLNILC